VVPSITEWFWFSAVETCALEKQLVVSNIGSLPEVVSGKINFVEPSNYKDIANKVIDFYNWKFQKINRKEFRWINNIEKTIKVYDSLLSKSNDNK
jgi:glycosyltransferase involved in cell wall biosynthesis